jgi:microcystin-dependent protein
MAEKISSSKGFDDTTFDTYVPELSDNADIQNALELFYYGDSTDGNATGDVSIHANLVDFDARITLTTSGLSGHTGAISDVHGIGAGHSVVGTGTIQTLTNKTLTTPKLNENVTLTATSTELNILDGATLTTTELNYLDGTTSPIQTQINTNTPTGMISIHAGSTAPTGWLLCDGTSYATTSYVTLFAVVGYTFGGSGANFNVPNLKGKVVVGIDAGQASFDTRGETGGAITHQHASSNSGNTSVAHNHTIPALSGAAAGAGAHNHNVDGAHSHSASHNHADTIAVTIGGGSHAHGLTGSVSANTTAIARASSGSTSPYFQSSGHAHADNFAVSTDSAHSHTATVSGGVTNIALNTGPTSANFATSSDGSNHGHSVSTNSEPTIDGAGGSHVHTTPASDTLSNLQPYIALNYIIKI